MVLRILVPYFAEQIQYAATRGRQRAEAEFAARQLPATGLAELSRACQLVAKRVAPSVVHINVISVTPLPEDEFTSFYGYRFRRTEGQGSGVLVDSAGYIVTNHHVVRGATEIQVSLSDGRILGADVVGSDPPTDLAVLKVADSSRFISAEWGDSEALQPGSLVWALGSPFGLQKSVTFGILSARDRAGNSSYVEFLQTDAAVNPGNSGGPLVDEKGTVIGINTAIVGEAYQGISFAIPSSVARRIYDKIRADGAVERGWLGVELRDLTNEVAAQLNLDAAEGVLVVGFADLPGSPSPARVAGVQPGDVITRWNGEPVADVRSLLRLVAMHSVGSEIQLDLLRNGQNLRAEFFTVRTCLGTD